MTTPIELLQSRKPGAPGCIYLDKTPTGYIILGSSTNPNDFKLTTWTSGGQFTSRNGQMNVSTPYPGRCYVTTKKQTGLIPEITVQCYGNSEIIFIHHKVTLTVGNLQFSNNGGFTNPIIYKWDTSTLNLTTVYPERITNLKLTLSECNVRTVNVQAKIFDSEENAVAFVNSLPDTDPSRTLNLESTMDAGIKNAMKTAAQAKGWTVNETEMSQAQQSANNITEQQADNDLQKELASVQQELQSDKVINGTTPGGIFGVAEQSAPDLEYVDSTEKEQPQVEQTTVATSSQEDTQKQA